MKEKVNSGENGGGETNYFFFAKVQEFNLESDHVGPTRQPTRVSHGELGLLVHIKRMAVHEN